MNFINKLSPNKDLVEYGGQFMGVKFYFLYKGNTVQITPGYENLATDVWYDSLYDWLEEYGFKTVGEAA